ncbi:hypothetical protein AB0O58_23950, partial [Rhodococcus sp. NPDC080181]|uniref:hypothetical protein n=1 Tax=Rhodococcus sp. NPDC080181 TaxID=3155292 RepID=UPI00344B77A2
MNSEQRRLVESGDAFDAENSLFRIRPAGSGEAASYGGRPVNDGMVKRWHAPSCVPPLPVAGMVI